MPMMRRQFIALFITVAFMCGDAAAQRPEKVWRIAWLNPAQAA
jgi:hypothetical protein